MKKLMAWAARPVPTGLLASLPLWLVFGNYVVALMAGLLGALMVSMCVQLAALRRDARQAQTTSPKTPPRPRS